MRAMPAAWLSLLPAALLALHAVGARGQIPVELRERTPVDMAREAFASDYGRLVVVEFGKTLRESADADCLLARKIDADQLTDHGREIMQRHGARMLDAYWKLYDTRRFEVMLGSRGGINAKAEIIQLRKDPGVKKLLELYQPAKLATVVDNVTEVLDRHAQLTRIKLTRRISPRASGDEAILRANPSDQSAEAVERFLRKHKTPQVKRWVALEDAMLQATEYSMDRAAMLKLGPIQLAAGLGADLAALCVPSAPLDKESTK
jgi:hypothetical protein